MPNRLSKKRPRDLNELAAQIAGEATGGRRSVVVVPKQLSDKFESGEATIEDLRALLEVEAASQGWSLDAALAWARSRKPARNYIQADIKALVSLLDLCCAA